jgi:hypothetical protein
MAAKPDGELSRRREYRTNLLAAGLCMKCGRLRIHYALYCDEHAAEHRDQVRADNRKRCGIPLDAPVQNKGRRRLA